MKGKQRKCIGSFEIKSLAADPWEVLIASRWSLVPFPLARCLGLSRRIVLYVEWGTMEIASRLTKDLPPNKKIPVRGVAYSLKLIQWTNWLRSPALFFRSFVPSGKLIKIWELVISSVGGMETVRTKAHNIIVRNTKGSLIAFSKWFRYIIINNLQCSTLIICLELCYTLIICLELLDTANTKMGERQL